MWNLRKNYEVLNFIINIKFILKKDKKCIWYFKVLISEKIVNNVYLLLLLCLNLFLVREIMFVENNFW